MIEVENLSKVRRHLAVGGLSFVVQPGMVTGFLGPHGAGLRCRPQPRRQAHLRRRAHAVRNTEASTRGSQ